MKTDPSFLQLSDGMRIAYHKTPAKDNSKPGIIFVHGFRSDMGGTKALALEAFCQAWGYGFIRFDCTGHGHSSGAFTEGTIGRWTEDLLAVIDRVSEGRQVLVGSSMGGWLMLLAALRRPGRVAGLLGIAAAPDFTEYLVWDKLSAEQKRKLEVEGVIDLSGTMSHSETEAQEPYPITQLLVEEARNHLLLNGEITLHCPVRLLHGMRDADVPYATSLQIARCLASTDVNVILSKSGGHRMSEPADIALLATTLEYLVKSLPEAA